MASNSNRNTNRKKSTPSGVSVTGSASSASAADRKTKRAEAVAEMKQAQAARERRSRLLMAGGVVAALLVIVVAVVVVGLNHTTSTAKKKTAASSTVASAIAAVPASVFDTIGVGTAQAGPTGISGGTPLTSGGKPEVLYIGAEYCPFCAAERWALATALARFGTLSGLGQTYSSATDVYPNTPTLSFHGVTLKSDYVAFKGYEETTNQPDGQSYQKLDTVPAADQAIANQYGSGSIPFIYIAGKYTSSGAAYDPGLLKGMSHAAIATALSDPDSTIAKAVDGSANLMTAAICQTTDNQPSDVCSSSGVQTALKALESSAKSGS